MSFSVQPGEPRSPVILHVPHASRELTARARASIVLDDAALEDELDHLTDARTDVIAARAAEASAIRPWVFVNALSRLVVDPERFPDEREEMLAAGMGAVYTHGYAGRRLREVVDPGLLDEHFHPYAKAMTDLVADRLEATGRAVIIDVHSYPTEPLPYELHGDGPRPPVCLGADDFHTPPELLAGFGPFATEVNTPFAGCYVPLRYYGVEPAVTAVMIEIRRDIYLTEPGGLDAVAAALTALVDSVS